MFLCRKTSNSSMWWHSLYFFSVLNNASWRNLDVWGRQGAFSLGLSKQSAGQGRQEGCKCLAFLATVRRSKGALSFLPSHRKRSHEPAGQLLNRVAAITNQRVQDVIDNIAEEWTTLALIPWTSSPFPHLCFWKDLLNATEMRQQSFSCLYGCGTTATAPGIQQW